MTDRSKDHWRGRHYDADHITGPVGFLNPTTRFLSVHRPKGHTADTSTTKVNEETNGSSPDTAKGPASPALEKPTSHTGVYTLWRSRDNRKGRHALVLTPSAAKNKTGVAAPAAYTNTWSATTSGIKRMIFRYPVWDVSYDVAVVFTLGSVSGCSRVSTRTILLGMGLKHAK